MSAQVKQILEWGRRLSSTTVVVEQVRFLQRCMRRARLTEGDILEPARDNQGIEHVEQIKFAIVDRNGKGSIILQE